MGATELGIYVLAFSWCVLLANLASVGIPNAAMRFVGYGLANAQPGYIRGFALTGLKIVLSSSLCVVAFAMAALFLYGHVDRRLYPTSLPHSHFIGCTLREIRDENGIPSTSPGGESRLSEYLR